MKKFLYITIVAILSLNFIACGDDDVKSGQFTWGGDWNDATSEGYPKFIPSLWPDGYNPIYGLWENTEVSKTGLYFSKKFYPYTVTFLSETDLTREIWMKSVDPEDDDPNMNKYIINDKAFRLYKGNYYSYTIQDDILTIEKKPEDPLGPRTYKRVSTANYEEDLPPEPDPVPDPEEGENDNDQN